MFLTNWINLGLLIVFYRGGMIKWNSFSSLFKSKILIIHNTSVYGLSTSTKAIFLCKVQNLK